MAELEDLQEHLGYIFKDVTLLKIALTHKSYINEAPDKEKIKDDNERLEFLGDAVLGLVISEACVQNLDLSKKFITVIPKEKENDPQYIKERIVQNRDYCLSIDRTEIRDYAKTFNWKNIAKQYENHITHLKETKL